MFPKGANLMTKTKAAEIRRLAVWISENPNSSSTFAQSVQQELDAHLKDADQLTKARRLDAWIKSPDGQEVFIDATGSHSTAKSYLARTVSHCAKARASKIAAAENGIPDPMARTPTPNIAAAVTLKVANYGPMMELADKKRSKSPKLFILAFSRLGEFSPHVFELVDWICKQFVRFAAPNIPSPDGASIAVRRCRFRAEFLNELTCAVAAGTGRILKEAGFPNHNLLW
jgi:hypothetical protein